MSRFYGVGGIGIQLNWFITGLIGGAVRMVSLHGFWMVSQAGEMNFIINLYYLTVHMHFVENKQKTQ